MVEYLIWYIVSYIVVLGLLFNRIRIYLASNETMSFEKWYDSYEWPTNNDFLGDIVIVSFILLVPFSREVLALIWFVWYCIVEYPPLLTITKWQLKKVEKEMSSLVLQGKDPDEELINRVECLKLRLQR